MRTIYGRLLPTGNMILFAEDLPLLFDITRWDCSNCGVYTKWNYESAGDLTYWGVMGCLADLLCVSAADGTAHDDGAL